MDLEIKDREGLHSIDDKLILTMLAQGNTAEVYQYDTNKILKLFRESMPFTPIKQEYKISNIIYKRLENVPKVYDLVTYQNRYGIIYEQIIGIDMVKLFLQNVFRIKHYSDMLADIHATIHKQELDVQYSLKQKLQSDIDHAEELTEQERNEIKQYLENLPDKSYLCHFDFHPGNIMFRNKQPVIIDWMTACTGDPSADVARTMLLMQMGEMTHINPILQKIIHLFMTQIGKEYIKEYRRITNVPMKEIDQWMLPVAAARLSEWLSDHERAKLLLLVRNKLKIMEHMEK